MSFATGGKQEIQNCPVSTGSLSNARKFVEEEKRLAEDGEGYTYEEFLNLYGKDDGHAIWELSEPWTTSDEESPSTDVMSKTVVMPLANSSKVIEFRLSVDGVYYTKEEFQWYFQRLAEWDAAAGTATWVEDKREAIDQPTAMEEQADSEKAGQAKKEIERNAREDAKDSVRQAEASATEKKLRLDAEQRDIKQEVPQRIVVKVQQEASWRVAMEAEEANADSDEAKRKLSKEAAIDRREEDMRKAAAEMAEARQRLRKEAAARKAKSRSLEEAEANRSEEEAAKQARYADQKAGYVSSRAHPTTWRVPSPRVQEDRASVKEKDPKTPLKQHQIKQAGQRTTRSLHKEAQKCNSDDDTGTDGTGEEGTSDSPASFSTVSLARYQPSESDDGSRGDGPLDDQLDRTEPSCGHFVATETGHIDRLIDVGGITSNDVVLDLGSGDGRLLRELTARTGCRGVGVEIASQRHRAAVEQSQILIKDGSLKFVHEAAEDINVVTSGSLLFPSDVCDEKVTVVYVYLLFLARNPRVQELLQRFLDFGIRVITNTFQLPDAIICCKIRSCPDPHTVEGIFDRLSSAFQGEFHMYQGIDHSHEEVDRREIEVSQRERELRELGDTSAQQKMAEVMKSAAPSEVLAWYQVFSRYHERAEELLDEISWNEEQLEALDRELEELELEEMSQSGRDGAETDGLRNSSDVEMHDTQPAEQISTRLASKRSEMLQAQEQRQALLDERDRLQHEVSGTAQMWENWSLQDMAEDIKVLKAQVALEEAKDRLTQLKEALHTGVSRRSASLNAGPVLGSKPRTRSRAFEDFRHRALDCRGTELV